MSNEGFRENHMRRVTIRKDANQLTDRLVETYTDDEIVEFMCWMMDRLGNKHDKDVAKLSEALHDTVENVYEKLPESVYEKFDRDYTDAELRLLDILDIIFSKDGSELEEYDESLGSDDCSLWESLDEPDESED